MIGSLGNARIYGYCEPTDMRKGCEGLSALVPDQLAKEPLSGSLFLFTNKRRTLAKILWFDGIDMCVLAERIERGRFAALWKHTSHSTLPLKRSELELFLEGSELVGRYQVSPPPLSAADLAPWIEIRA